MSMTLTTEEAKTKGQEPKFDHEFKSHPDVFWPAARGEKTFEYRRDDRGGYEVGQTVRLRCYDPDHGYHGNQPLDRRITNILRGGEFELPQGYCILSLAPLAAPRTDSAERTVGADVHLDAIQGIINHGVYFDPTTGRYCGALAAAEKIIGLKTPAPATPPGVPDSVQALLEEARSGLMAYAGGTYGACRDTLARIDNLLATHPAGQSETPILRAVIEVYPDRTDTRLTFGDRIRPEPSIKAVEQAIAALTAEYEARGGCPVVGRHPAGQSAGSRAEDYRPLRMRVADTILGGVRPGQEGAFANLNKTLDDVLALIAPVSTHTGDEGTEDQRSAWARAAETVGPDKPWWWDKPWAEMGYGSRGDVQAWFQNRDPLRRVVEPDNPDRYVRLHCDPRPHMLAPAPVSTRTGDEGAEPPWPEQYAALADGYGPVEEWRDWTKRAERDPFSDGALHALRGMIGEFVSDALSARPAVPEAQGAWRSQAADDVLAEKRRADTAEAALATSNSELARLRAEVEAKDKALRQVKTWIDTDLPAGTSRAGILHRVITKALDRTALARPATAREGA